MYLRSFVDDKKALKIWWDTNFSFVKGKRSHRKQTCDKLIQAVSTSDGAGVSAGRNSGQNILFPCVRDLIRCGENWVDYIS